MAKQYGLIVPGKNKPAEKPIANFTKPSIFGSDSESDDGPSKLVKMCPAPVSIGATERRQAKALQKKALAEDPTVFQYDELYDEIESKREEEKIAKKSEVKKPKYIERLLVHAERRKLENERRVERMVQKEREAEGEKFKDKESYVTAAYRKKLEELKKAEEEEKREEYLESIGDVTKQQDLGGFYRHLYEQKLGPKDTKKSTEATEITGEENSLIKIPKVSKPRTYRKRQSSNEEESFILDNNTKTHIQSNIDADSDFSIDSSSDSDSEDSCKPSENKKAKVNETVKVKKEFVSDSVERLKIENSSLSNSNEKVKIKEKDDEREVKIEKIEDKPKKPKVDIWKKRTVGEIFDGALQRYYERKAAKCA